MKKVGFVCILVLTVTSCQKHFMKMKLNKPLEKNVVGVLVQLVENEDTSNVSREMREYMNECDLIPLTGIFKKEIYQKENFDLLFSMDSSFIAGQPGLYNLKHLLVCRIEFVMKTDDQSKKDNAWITFFGRWMMLKPLKKVHDFYYLEKVAYTGSPNDKDMLVSFLVAQMHIKFCMDIKKYIPRNE